MEFYINEKEEDCKNGRVAMKIHVKSTSEKHEV
jgi:hypothetical protein